MLGVRVVQWWTPPVSSLHPLSLSHSSPSSGLLLIWSPPLSTGAMIHVVPTGPHSPHTDTAQSCPPLSICPSVSACSPSLWPQARSQPAVHTGPPRPGLLRRVIIIMTAHIISNHYCFWSFVIKSCFFPFGVWINIQSRLSWCSCFLSANARWKSLMNREKHSAELQLKYYFCMRLCSLTD